MTKIERAITGRMIEVARAMQDRLAARSEFFTPHAVALVDERARLENSLATSELRD